MRIVKLAEFLTLPAGTVFAKFEPCDFEELLIKGETSLTYDFCYQQIASAIKSHNSGEWADLLFESLETGKSIPMDFNFQKRDGCFESTQLFAVFERADVEALIVRLQATLDYCDCTKECLGPDHTNKKCKAEDNKLPPEKSLEN